MFPLFSSLNVILNRRRFRGSHANRVILNEGSPPERDSAGQGSGQWGAGAAAGAAAGAGAGGAQAQGFGGQGQWGQQQQFGAQASCALWWLNTKTLAGQVVVSVRLSILPVCLDQYTRTVVHLVNCDVHHTR